MPIHIFAEGIFNGVAAVPYASSVLRVVPWIILVSLLKYYFGGARNKSERTMHSKVIMITGGTSGVGASVARSLAERGAQIVLLTHHPASDPFLVDYVEDLRSETSNELIYAEQVNLSSLHAIRLFATKWIDNAPPRRLDAIILCAATLTPPSSNGATKTIDGIEENWGINYLANFHLLSILSPAIRAQPPDRDVRIIMATCSSYIGAQLDVKDTLYKKRSFSSNAAYSASKFALMLFALSFQKHLDAYERPDKRPNGAHVMLVDPGWSRTPGMRRWLSVGSLWGLLVYLVTWPLWWLVLKSSDQGAQSFLNAVMEADMAQGVGSKVVKECRLVDCSRRDVEDESLQKDLWKVSEELVQALEKEGAMKRNLEKSHNTEKKKESNGDDKVNGKVPGSRRSRKADASS
ncbi:MAG: hypothetical protein M1833_003419 [Piccolia ochrophora]|nr:MAG: hypothetical protein M1833_003419 [Piccolia ochrophora]